MNIDFEKDILDWSNKTILQLGYELSDKNEASSRLAQVFGILRNRIPQKKRTVQIAKNFSCPKKLLDGYKQTIFEIKKGKDLMPRCSRQQTNKTGYIDRMLLDWGIYHLHLGTKKIKTGKNKGLIQGNKEILFIFITDEVAHIIGIFDHSSWTKLEVLQIVHDNWPNLLEPWRQIGVIDLVQEVTDDDRKSLRDCNINSAVKIGNNVYSGPGGGITAGGTGTNEIQKALIVLRAADNLYKWVIENKSFIEKNINARLIKIKFDVSRFILSRTFSVYDPENKIRIFIESKEPIASLIHPTQAIMIEPERENYSYYKPGSFSGILIHTYRK